MSSLTADSFIIWYKMDVQEPLSAQQSRLQDDLRGLIRGDARCDDLTLRLFSSDGSPWQERPTGVVWPRSTQDVAAVVQYAEEKGLSVHFRGSGTGGTAGAIGSGLVVDFSRYMRRVLETGSDYVRVQPGAIRERVNGQLRATTGRFFAPSSGHVPTGTVGSILAVDNIGPRWLRYGAPHESALELTVVSARGEIWNLRPFRASRVVLDERSELGEPLFRRRFLNATLAEANARSYAADAEPFDAAFDAELTASVGSPDAPFFGLDFYDGYGVRSFRNAASREEFFRRAFGADAAAVRELVGSRPWAEVIRAIRDVEPYLDEEQRPDAPLRCGFPLRDAVRNGFDPSRLFIGTEGALGGITEAKLYSFPISPASSAAILLFDSVEKATRAVPAILQYDPTLCDLLDSRVVSLARDWDSRFESIFTTSSEAALVVEFDPGSDEELRTRTDALFREARAKLDSFGFWTAFTDDERFLFRDLLRKSSCARMRMAPSFQPFPFWDDVRAPVEAIPEFLHAVQELFKREHIVYSASGSIGCGQLSIQPILPYSDDEARRVYALSDEFEELVLSFGGEIGVARGNGRIRAAFLPKRFPRLFRAFVRVKDALDPACRLNPDAVVSPEMRSLALRDPAAPNLNPDESDGDYLAPETDAALRESSLHSRSIAPRTPYTLEKLNEYAQIDWLNRPKRSQLEFQLAWDPTLVYAPTYQCNGCGHCRIRTAETRMCPAFRNAPDEQSSCRAKANLLRGALDGDLELATLTRDMARKIAERCLRCHCCETECPAQVDVPRLAFRLMSAWRAASGMGMAELFAVRANFALSVATRFSGLTRRALASPGFRWLLEKTLGIAQGRKLPVLERRSYLSGATRRRANSELLALATLPGEEGTLDAEEDGSAAPYVITQKKNRRRVALFIDSYANFFDCRLVDAAIGLLERGGAAVTVPARPASSGVVAFAIGDIDRAEEFATRNVSIFRELVRDGSEIVTLEPSSAVCIKREYPYFCADSDAKFAISNTTDVCSYLARLARDGTLDFESAQPLAGDRKLTVGYHAPCRSIALSGESVYAATHAQTLLSRIPNLEVRRLERGCCGFAGYSGFTKRRFTESLRIGSRVFLAARSSALDYRASECSFCNLQMAQGTKKPVAHVLKMLAVSFGLMSLDEIPLETIDVKKRKAEKDVG